MSQSNKTNLTKRKSSWGLLILVAGTTAGTNKCIMMKRWAGSPCSFWCFGKCHTRLGPTCLPGYYGWHYESCSPSLSPLPYSRDSQAPPQCIVAEPRTLPQENPFHWPEVTASTETGFIQFVPLKLHSVCFEDVHCQLQLRVRGQFLLYLAAILRGECALLWHIYAWLGYCFLYRCVFLVLI